MEATKVKVMTIIFSHLSNIEFYTLTKDIRRMTNFVKYLLDEYTNTLESDIDPEKAYSDFLTKYPQFK